MGGASVGWVSGVAEGVGEAVGGTGVDTFEVGMGSVTSAEVGEGVGSSGSLGTYSFCPVKIWVEVPIQLPCWSWATVMPVAVLRRVRVCPACTE